MDKRYKQFAASVEVVADRKMAFTISTAAVDRDGDTIDPKGWALDNYLKNPVVLWAHDYSQPPIGKAVNVQATKDGLRAEVEFVPQGKYPFADMIHDMVKDGFLSATSVGFVGSKYDKASDRERGFDFKGQELLEFSIVPVPSNPEALAQRGLKLSAVMKYAGEMHKWAGAIIGQYEQKKLSDEQFDGLADAIAKIMKEGRQAEEPVKPEAQPLDMQAIAKEVAKILKEAEAEESVLDIKDITESEVVWDEIEISEPASLFDAEKMSALLLESVRETMREMAGAQAQAAINRMTGRLD